MYRLFGMEVSPYSVKVRALLRYKNIPHQWVLRNKANEAAFREHAKLPIIPLLVTPEGDGLQDSTPLIDLLESRHPEPSIRLQDPVLNFLADALEEAADEWLIKAMFHYRWNHDSAESSLRIASASVDPGTDPSHFAKIIGGVLMSRRDSLGCSDDNAKLIENYLDIGATRLEAHLQKHRFLFGDQLSVADLGLASQYYELFTDSTPKQRLAAFPALQGWVEDSMNPTGADGRSASWEALSETLLPILEHELGAHYLPWAQATALALRTPDNATVNIRLNGRAFSQPAQKYVGKSWQALKLKWQALATDVQSRTPELVAAHFD